MTTLNLTKKQHEAVTQIANWLNSDEKSFALAGYAGSGKTTLARRIAEKFGGVFCAYTGKAAMVLRSKGIEACTIHSLLYNYQGIDKETKEIIWSLNQTDGKFLIVDEYSMLDRSMVNDILSSFKKVLFLGDPAQLPPIRESEQIIEPNCLLTEVHRQAADSPILKQAHMIRSGHIPYNNMNLNDEFVVKRQSELTDEEIIKADCIIAGMNKTVHDINMYVRSLLGYSEKSSLPVVGDKLMQLKNNNRLGFINGYTFTADNNAYGHCVDGERYNFSIDGESYKFWDGDVLGRPSKEYSYFSKLERIGYAYAMTCHKSQGSEYDNVIIINEAWGDHKLNWLYTAVTRGKKKVTLVHKDK